jgi:hypothetical protein
MKNGKRPLSDRNDYVSPAEAFGGGDLTLEPEVAAHLKEKGLGFKWLSIKHIKANGGRHRSGWQVFQCPEGLKRPSNLFGTSPDGTITIGDLVLGVKPLKGPGVTVENHKKVLAQRVRDRTAAAFGTGTKGAISVEDDEE